jgi:uncharacterized protein YciI
MLRRLIVALILAPSIAAAQPAPAVAAEAPKADATLHLFAVLLRPGPAWQTGRPFKDQGLGKHFTYWKSLFDQGRVVSAGPLGADSGLVLLYAHDQANAEAILHDDPAIIAGIFVGKALPYAPPMISAEPAHL